MEWGLMIALQLDKSWQSWIMFIFGLDFNPFMLKSTLEISKCFPKYAFPSNHCAAGG